MQSNVSFKKLILPILVLLIVGNVNSQIVSTNAFLKGNYVEVGIGPCGTYGSSVNAPPGYHPRGNGSFLNRLGFVADPNKDGWAIGTPNYCGDYFVPGTPEEGFGVQINGANYNNNMLCGEVTIPGSIIDYRISGTNTIGTWSGTIAGLQITTATTVPLNDVFFISEVTLRNTTGATMNNVYYMRNVDPDNEVTLPGGDYETTNFVVAQNPNIGSRALVSATGLDYGCYLGLGTLDCRARVAFGGFSNRNPAAVWNGISPLSQSGSTTDDVAIAIAFKINSLAPGESTTFRFAHVLAAADLERALNLTVPSLQVNGIPVDNNSTVNVCAGVSVPLQIINGSAYTFTWSPSTGLNTTTGSSVIATVNSTTTYTATGVDACGSNVSLSVTLNPTATSVLGTIGAISGPASVCLPAANQTYSVSPVTNATLYEWTVPSGTSIVGGDGTNAITVSFSSAVSGIISVRARNGCGITNISTLAINAATTNPPDVIFSNVNVTVPAGVTGFNLTYPAPIILSNVPVTFTYSPASGSFFPLGITPVTVTASNSCGSITRSFTVTVTSVTDPTVYYSKASGDLHNVLTWGLNPDGSGAPPPDFTAGKTFNLANRPGIYTLTDNWMVGGILNIPAGSLLQISSFTLSIADITGTGVFSGTTASNLVVMQPVSSGTVLNFAASSNDVNNLNILSTATTNVSSALDVFGTLTINAGTLNTNNFITLKSTALNTARVAPITGSITGTVTVERYIPARRAWRILSAPVGGTQSINAAWQEGATTASVNPNLNPGFGTHITEGNPANGFDQNPAVAMVSAKRYVSTTNSWVNLANTNATAVNADAYMVFVRGNRGTPLGLNTVPATITTLRCSGPLKVGDQTFAVSATGFTAIPNPFASPVNFATITRTGVGNNFSVWDPKVGGINGVGAYVTISFNGTSYDVSSNAVSPESQYIQSGQGFLVTAATPGVAGSVTIKESDKSNTAAADVFRAAGGNRNPDVNTAPVFADPTQGNGLRIQLQTEGADGTIAVLDEVFASFKLMYSNRVDQFDAAKATNMAENLGMEREGRTLAIERRTIPVEGDIINLKLWNTEQKRYTLKFNPINLSATGVFAYLEDKYLKTLTTIELDKKSQFSFTITSDAASTRADRFNVVFSKTAKPTGGIVKNAFAVYPNPIDGRNINLQFSANHTEGNYLITIVNGGGRIMLERSVVHTGGAAVKNIQLDRKLPAGVYQMRINNKLTQESIKIISH